MFTCGLSDLLSLYMYMTLDRKLCLKKISTICLKKQLINIYKTRYKYFRSDIIYVQNWRVCELLECILAIQKQPTNRPQLNKSDRPQVNNWNTWKTLKYTSTNINKNPRLLTLIQLYVSSLSLFLSMVKRTRGSVFKKLILITFYHIVLCIKAACGGGHLEFQISAK
jgi:hypothetical protein